MSAALEDARPQQDAAPLLRQVEVEASSSLEGDVEQQVTAPGPVARFMSWLTGSRQAEPVSSSDEDSELQQRGQQAAGQPASIAVLAEDLEAAEAGAAGTAAGSSSGGSVATQEPRGGSTQPPPPTQQQQGSAEAGAADADGDAEIQDSGSPKMARLPSRGPPTCLICLEEFTQEEFINGSALRLECSCRGDLALRHRDCVMKWVQVKGSNVCELCKAEIRNIPAPPQRPTEADLPTLDEAYFNDPSHIHDFMPSSQDLVFDCIRVTWVAMIVSILFFEMSLGAALWTGLLAGCAYSVMVRLMYRQHFYAMRRLAEQQAAARREQEASTASTTADAAPTPQPVVVAV